jgi:hypothetical protein
MITEIGCKIRVPIALYALWIGSDEMSVLVSSAGIQVSQTETHKTAPQFMIQNVKESWLARANVAMDIVLKYLDDNKVQFPEYESPNFDTFIPNAKDFQKAIDIRESRRVFISIKPIIVSIENKFILPTLGLPYYNELKAKMNGSGSGDLSEDDKKVIELIRAPLAHLTMARALQEIKIDVLDWGVFETSANTFDKVQGKAFANRDRVSVMQQANESDGLAELKGLQEYLDSNASETKYATYFHSTAMIATGVNEMDRGQFKNDKTRGIFVA